MDINDFSTSKLWAIHPPYLEQMISKIPDAETMAALQVKFAEDPNGRDELQLIDGVAIIPISGPISQRRSFFSSLFGGADFNALTAAMMEALVSNQVKAILLDIDSPGGTVAGSEAFADMVYEGRKEKPIVAYANGMMASAAYWIGSGASKTLVQKTSQVGSIGIMMIHNDWSGQDAEMGVTRTVLSAGKYKALGNNAEPLTDLAKDTFQAEIDYVYTLFVDAVSRNLGVDPEAVLADMADGRTFIGQQAIDAGLVDGLGAFDDALSLAVDLASRGSKQQTLFTTTGAASPERGTTVMDKKISIPTTLEEMKAALPDLFKLCFDQGAASIDQVDASQVSGAERDRILGLASVQFGEDAGGKFKAIVDSGVTVEQFTAVRETTPETPTATGGAQDDMLEAIHNAGADNPGADGSQTQVGDKGFMVLVDEYAILHKCSKTDAMKSVIRTNPAEHEAYLESVQ